MHRVRFFGIDRSRLAHLVTRKEARKFGWEPDLGALHRQVCGLNPIRLRRLLSTLEREDCPADPHEALVELRGLALAGRLAVPEESLDDVCGHEAVKKRLRVR